METIAFTPFSSDQSRLMIDAAQHYEQWLSVMRKLQSVKGWMSWRTQSGKDYLISGYGSGNQRSHGPRSPQTEAIYRSFNHERDAAQEFLKEINQRLNERAPMLKAIRMGRIPEAMSRVIREFDVHEMIGTRLLIGGTHALSGYEALSGQWFESSMTATEDLDFVWRSRMNAELLVKGPTHSLMQHLKNVDTSYTVNTERTFQVRNSKGMVIDFISDDAGVKDSPNQFLRPIAIKGQQWLINCEHIEVVIIDSSGLPVRLFVPDPRVFSIHKAWVSTQANRSPLKSPKDLRQAKAVAIVTKKYLPQYPFDQQFISTLDIELQTIFERFIEPLLANIHTELTTML